MGMTLIEATGDDECNETTQIENKSSKTLEVLVGEEKIHSNVFESIDSNNQVINCDGKYDSQIVNGGVTLQSIDSFGRLTFKTDDLVDDETFETVQFEVWLKDHKDSTKTTISKTVKYANPCSAATLTKKDGVTFNDIYYIMNGSEVKEGCISASDLVDINTYESCEYEIIWTTTDHNNV